MMLVDTLVLNDDRHLGNLGFILRDGRLTPAPIFDTGNSLFFHKHTEGMHFSPDMLRYVTAKPFASDVRTQLRLISKDRLQHVPNFLPKLENLLQTMVQEGLPTARAEFAFELVCTMLMLVWEEANKR